MVTFDFKSALLITKLFCVTFNYLTIVVIFGMVTIINVIVDYEVLVISRSTKHTKVDTTILFDFSFDHNFISGIYSNDTFEWCVTIMLLGPICPWGKHNLKVLLGRLGWFSWTFSMKRAWSTSLGSLFRENHGIIICYIFICPRIIIYNICWHVKESLEHVLHLGL
jgi:hypothetical protein